MAVHDALLAGMMLRYVNGDPVLFNPVANAVFDCYETLQRRGELQDETSAKTHIALVRRPVELVGRLVSDLSDPARRRVGGKIHDLLVSPGGAYESGSGD